MAGIGLSALLDDITSILDDVSVLTKVAAEKTAGVPSVPPQSLNACLSVFSAMLTRKAPCSQSPAPPAPCSHAPKEYQDHKSPFLSLRCIASIRQNRSSDSPGKFPRASVFVRFCLRCSYGTHTISGRCEYRLSACRAARSGVKKGMPTVFTHPAPILALGAGLGFAAIPPRLLFAAVACSLMPDLDVIGFRFAVPYTDILGHRGLSHSLPLALAFGLMGWVVAPWLHARRTAAFLGIFAATASHAVLDALTSGGFGVALFWPLSNERFFFPVRPIPASPFSPNAFLEPYGRAVLRAEGLWIWLPCLAAAFLLRVGLWTGRAFPRPVASTTATRDKHC